jgi:hypothetical protein
MEDLTGLQLGPYQIVAPLGEGGMAAVYQAYQPSMDRYVALKVLPRHFASEPQFAGRFEQEAKVIARLQHPHILPVFDYGQAQGYTYIAMPFIKSGTLAALLTGQPLPLARIQSVISQVGDALDYAHSFGVVHRDVKPSNVLVDERGNCLLTDFGIAKMVEGTAAFTRTGGVIGTPAYMSPEQGTGSKVDQRSDIYSLGVVLYEMATGRVPYQAETPIAVVFKHARDPLPPPRALNPALPQGVERVILKSLAKQPDDRYATAGAMVQALQTGLADRAPAETRREPPGGSMLTAATRVEPPPAYQPAAGPGGVSIAPSLAGLPPVAVVPARRPFPAWAVGLGCLAALGLILVLAAGGAFVVFGPLLGLQTATQTPTFTPTVTVAPPSATASAVRPSATPVIVLIPSDTPTGPPTRTASPTQPPTRTASPTAPVTDTPITPSPTPTPTPTEAPAFVDQPSYAGDCTTRPPGTVCVRFSDDYVWLIDDSVAGRADGGTYEGQPVEVVLGFNADYHHVLGTTLVRLVQK